MSSNSSPQEQEMRESGFEKKGGYEPMITKVTTDLPKPPPNVDPPQAPPAPVKDKD